MGQCSTGFQPRRLPSAQFWSRGSVSQEVTCGCAGTREGRWRAERSRHGATSIPISWGKALGSCHPHLPGQARPPLILQAHALSPTSHLDLGGSPVIRRLCPRAPAALAPWQKLSGQSLALLLELDICTLQRSVSAGFHLWEPARGWKWPEPWLEYLQAAGLPRRGCRSRKWGETECKPGALGARMERRQRRAGTGRTRGTASFPAVSTQTEGLPGCGRRGPGETSPMPEPGHPDTRAPLLA